MPNDPIQTPSSSPHPGENPLPAADPASPVPAEILAWARSQVSIEQVLAGLREIEQNGGIELRDFIRELEEAAGDHD